MAIYVPPLWPPFMGTPEQWEEYFKTQQAGLEYVTAYGDTVGVFAMFSRKKSHRLKAARANYHKQRDNYWRTLGI